MINLRDNEDGTCNCHMLQKGVCFFTTLDERCNCKCHFPKEEIGCPICGELLKEYEIEQKLEICRECRENEEFGQKFG
jgi:hypothetical protein